MHPLSYSACQGMSQDVMVWGAGADRFDRQCEPNEADQNNPQAPCKTCLSVDKTSKKTIHNVPCVRFKITSVVIYRAGGLKLTERFTHTEVRNIASFGTTVTRKMPQGLCREPMTIKICRFEANDSDVLCRKYTSGGVTRKVILPAFCLQDVEKTAKDFEEYIRRHSLDGLKEAGREEHEIVRRTLAMISRHHEELPVSSPAWQFYSRPPSGPQEADTGSILTERRRPRVSQSI